MFRADDPTRPQQAARAACLESRAGTPPQRVVSRLPFAMGHSQGRRDQETLSALFPEVQERREIASLPFANQPGSCLLLHPWRFISRESQARARLQSRFTVIVEMPST